MKRQLFILPLTLLAMASIGFAQDIQKQKEPISSGDDTQILWKFDTKG